MKNTKAHRCWCQLIARCGGAVSRLCRLRTFLFQPVACQQVVGFCPAIWVYYAGVIFLIPYPHSMCQRTCKFSLIQLGICRMSRDMFVLVSGLNQNERTCNLLLAAQSAELVYNTIPGGLTLLKTPCPARRRRLRFAPRSSRPGPSK